MKVAELWRYPVKSMAGEQVGQAQFSALGIPGDRAFAVRQEGHTRNAKKFPALMEMRASYSEEPTDSHLPVPAVAIDGDTLPATDPTLAQRISEIVGHDVTIESVAPAENLEFYTRTEKRTLEETRAIFGLLEGEPFPDVSDFPARIAQFETPPGTFFDCYPVLIMTSASLEALAKAAPDSKIDVRRFRPNLLIDTDEAGFVEAAWEGRTLKAGSVEFSLEVRCPRCVMTTVGFHDLPRDTSIMRTLVRECEHKLGIYAEIKAPGTVKVGDEVTLS